MEKIDPVERVSGSVIRVLGLNPGPFTLQGTNTYVVGNCTDRILIDTADGKQEAYFENLKQVLLAERATLSHVIVTHRHHDHVGGIPRIKQIYPKARVWKCCADIEAQQDSETDPSGAPYEKLEHGKIFKVDDSTSLRVVETPGHCGDHVSLVLETTEKQQPAIFTGDCVLGNGSVAFENLYLFMKSLHLLKDELLHLKEPAKLFPGHGVVVQDGIGKINEYISHRQERESQILNCLFINSSSPVFWKVEDIVKIVYANQKLDDRLFQGACHSVTHHLEKLLIEGRVLKEGTRWSAADTSSSCSKM